MDREWLEEQLAAGRSIGAIAREVGCSESRVAYWINRHGLVAAGRERHRAKGPVEEDVLRELVEQGLSIRQIGRELDLSPTAVRHWLRRHGLRTQPSRYRRGADKPEAIVRECSTHGWTTFHLAGRRQHYRCGACNTERVARRRRRAKEILVEEAGGRCAVCGYDRYPGALQFHHVDPSEKRFEIGSRGLTRGLETLREEARRCILLCGNCHAEVEAGVTRLPFPAAPDEERTVGR